MQYSSRSRAARVRPLRIQTRMRVLNATRTAPRALEFDVSGAVVAADHATSAGSPGRGDRERPLREEQAAVRCPACGENGNYGRYVAKPPRARTVARCPRLAAMSFAPRPKAALLREPPGLPPTLTA